MTTNPNNCPTQGNQVRLAVKVATAADYTAAEQHEIVNESLRKSENVITLPALTGTLERSTQQRVRGPWNATGDIVMNAAPKPLDFWLEYVLGLKAGNVGAYTYTYADKPPLFTALIDRVAAKVTAPAGSTFEYDDTMISRAVFEGQQSQAIRATYTCFSRVRNFSGPAFPGISLGSGDEFKPYMFHEGTIDILGESRPFNRFRMTLDRALEVKHYNSISPQALCPQDWNCTLEVSADWTDDYAEEVFEQPGTNGSMVWSRNNMSCNWTFGHLDKGEVDPVTPGPDDVPYDMAFQILRDGANASISAVNDSVSAS